MGNGKEFLQVVKYLFLGLTVTLLQFLLVNVFPLFFSSWKEPLPPFLSSVFNESTMGRDNCNWGYVMTFFLSNLVANIYGYFINRKTVFHSDSPLWCFVLFAVVMVFLIIFSTWLQGMIAASVIRNFPSARGFQNTIAAALCGFLQNLVVFPLEKFVLLREEKGKS